MIIPEAIRDGIRDKLWKPLTLGLVIARRFGTFKVL